MSTKLSRRPNQYSEHEDSGFDIFRVLRVIKKKLPIFILIILLCVGIMTALAFITYEDKYTSSGSMLINPKVVQSNDGLNESVISTSDLNLATQLATTYKYLLTSDKVMNMVIKNCKLSLSANTLREMVSITQAEGTSIIKVSVTSTNGELAERIASELMVVLPNVVNEVLDFGSISVIDDPQVPTVPNSDKRRMLLPVLGFLIGIFISVIVAFIYDIASNAVKTVKDARTKIGTDIFSVIPFKETKRDNYGRRSLIDSAYSQFNFIEAYKSLRTKIETVNKENGYKKFIITSTYQSEGKSTVAANLAIALAQNGKTVVVVDADLRKPSLDRVLDLDAEGQTGIVQYLEGEADWKETVKYIGSHNIFIVLSGGTSDNPSELLSSDAMREFVDMLNNEFDYVIFDTPPAGVVTDAVVLSPLADASVMVVRQDYADLDNINGVIDDLSAGKTKVVGAVFNSTDFNKRSKYNRAGGYYYW